MFENYFKVGWRNLTKQKMYSAIKIGGMAIGVAACILITLFIRHELSYDQHYPDGERIYRVIKVYQQPDETLRGVHFPAPLASVLKDDYPEIELAGRFLASELFGAGSQEIRPAGKVENTYETGVIFADQELLEILQPSFVRGDVSHALNEPNTMAISQSKAEKYFPNEDPLGKTLIFNDDEKQPFTIAGVFKDFPATSHLQYHFLVTMTGRAFYEGEQTNWWASNYHTYIRVQPGTNAGRLSEKITQGIVQNYMLPIRVEAGRPDAQEFADNFSLELQPIENIHLYSAGIQDRLDHGDIRLVRMFGAVAGFILIIAGINFINLTTAKSASRALEVGLRKVVGSQRKHIIRQFLTESLLFSFLAFLLSMLLAWLLLPYFNELADKSLQLPWEEGWFIIMIIATAALVGILAGIYPSFYLSGFKPVQVLKGGGTRGSKSSRMRSLLVIFQFTVSIILIIGTLIIYRQMNFILNKELGFNKDQVLILQGTRTLGDQLPSFKAELLALSEVESASVTDYLPITGTMRNQNGFWKEGRREIDSSVGAQIWRVDHDFLKTMGLHLVEGRDFDPKMASDSQVVVINQSMARELSLDEPIGQLITNGPDTWQVIGVIQDFHYESMKETIEPLCLVIGNSNSIVAARITDDNLAGLVGSVEEVWRQFSPHQEMRYTFLDESFARMYDDVQRTGQIFTTFAILAIMVACLGLFALSAFMVEQRRKEISIRLVLGASLKNILRLLTQNFLLLVVIALLIAGPIAWYTMKRWLADYEYRIPIGWEVFALAGLSALLIAAVTISYQSIRAALENPVHGLRSD